MYMPFWKTAAVMLRYKRMLGLGMVGALISAACFGAGIGAVLPILRLMLNTDPSQRQTLQSMVNDWLLTPDRPEAVQAFGQWLLPMLPTDAFGGLMTVLGGVLVLTVVGSTGRFVHEYLTYTAAMRAVMIWRTRLFRRLIHAPLTEVLNKGSSDNISRLAFDTRMLVNGFQAVLGKSVEAVLKGLAALSMALLINWRLALLGMLGLPAIAILLRKFGKRIRKATRQALQERGRLIAAMNESMVGIRVVKVHLAEGYERRRFAHINRQLFFQEMRTRTVKAISGPVVDTLGLIGVMLVAGIAAWEIFRTGMEPAGFMTVLVALGAAAASIKPLSNLNNVLSEATAAAQRVLEVAELPVEQTGSHRPADAASLPRHRASVVFDQISYTYPNQARPAVDCVSLSIPHGQTVAIVGGNGSGKTTLLSLLPRLIEPGSGRVLIDGTDISQVSLRSLRKQLAVVTQQTILFSGTIADNIAYGRRHVSRNRIIEAAQAAFAHDFIQALPDGYDTVLAEGGEGLSGGQRQRLCIARAVLRDPAILILDEATSQIDADSEQKINQAMQQLRHGRTTLVIAHRLSTVCDADLIVVMQSGQVVDQGTHGELLQRCALYQLLARHQLQPTDAE